MQIEVIEKEYCKLNVLCSASTDEIKKAKDNVIKNFKENDIPGFRKGKAPLNIIKNHYKSQITQVAKHELAQMAYEAFLDEQDVRPFGNPEFYVLNLEEGAFKCEFTLHKLPSVALGKYKNFELPKGEVKDAVEMSEKIMQELRVLNGDTVRFEEEDFIQAGDGAIINYQGFFAGKQEPEVSFEGENFVVGEADVEAFNENLLGMKIGDRREFTVLMPENSANTRLAGKEIRFVVELGMASKRQLPALDDDFAKKMGSENIEALMGMVNGMASAKVEEQKARYLMEQASLRLIEEHKFEIPDWLALTEAKFLVSQNGSSWESINDETKEQFIKFGERNVRLSIILDKIRQEEPGAQMTDEEVYGAIQSNVSRFRNVIQGAQGKTDEEILNGIQQAGLLPSLMNSIKDEFTLMFIINNSTILE